MDFWYQRGAQPGGGEHYGTVDRKVQRRQMGTARPPIQSGSRDTANSKVSRRRVVRLSKNKEVDVKLMAYDLAPGEVFPMVPRGTAHVSG